MEGLFVDSADVVEYQTHGLLDIGGYGLLLGFGDLEVARLEPVLHLSYPANLLVVTGLYEGVVHQSDEGLEEQVPFDGGFVEEGHQGFQGEVAVDVRQGDRVPLDAEIRQQVEILHEVRPVVFVGVVPAF